MGFKLAFLVGSQDRIKCEKETGYNVMTAANVPDLNQLDKMCKSTACKTVMANIVEKDLPDC
ncbi:TPA: hypothetical protein N0F65_005567, partial [Lagenidium giganteum]